MWVDFFFYNGSKRRTRVDFGQLLFLDIDQVNLLSTCTCFDAWGSGYIGELRVDNERETNRKKSLLTWYLIIYLVLAPTEANLKSNLKTKGSEVPTESSSPLSWFHHDPGNKGSKERDRVALITLSAVPKLNWAGGRKSHTFICIISGFHTPMIDNQDNHIVSSLYQTHLHGN